MEVEAFLADQIQRKRNKERKSRKGRKNKGKK